MERYRVGGAVRDRLLGRPVDEVDWVVVGATPEAMEAAGYRPVGKDFPVFLHPQTGEEHALARTERKTAVGYHGFEFYAAPEVTLEQDLARRDLTINAMAEDAGGRLIDPFGGQVDLQARQLRHVTDAFAEDPVRILRLARFAARFADDGFVVADETMALCQRMVAAGEVDALVPERVWQELARGLMEPTPRRMIEVLRQAGALARLLPEVDALFGVPQSPAHHPEGDAGTHTLMALDAAAAVDASLEARFAVLLHDVGKALTPAEALPRHPGHEEAGVDGARRVSERLKAPRACRDLAVLVTRWHMHAHRALELRPGTVVELFEGLDLFRRPERLEPFLHACLADDRGRGGREASDWPAGDFLRAAFEACRGVSARSFVEQGLRGPEVGEAVREARCRAVAQVPRPDAGAARDGA
ncbi:multifunctional CCA addition/repair protein [Halorhodospira halophila]|uniref:Multifunctional CCA protein n=1 Tax=Halorhodospira halophila (strain DSM 244 / SL1) TaxID=349124 RepID=CCA_HALHL|nr:multifunctional CCA addition/repair protein [Halorhodospira halophila]A1WZI2.1 RecName: Full=Multifunctional CCA protein; Includes: RecName: Full=CCA-adding enzyme; AltName: Full=CCA tRNA nucleotidyltransferase; AltName: Full=tRNA CCA-pyrophosphorylase; AltName: Full=tRNA adenylyl-/cytidylyl-transferase; AltName: Full=tRNA nucleotidyltransferase; AltName: Full=tRNA-NT; Includes: RecName: Full=2'-nucleotidase; Includes: RecName: Full=2',3'-cyclic phosphodiesterase; Includes: RecName: Full=Phosph